MRRFYATVIVAAALMLALCLVSGPVLRAEPEEPQLLPAPERKAGSRSVG